MGPYTTAAVDMLDFFERQRDWSYETFGPPGHRGPLGPLDHLAKEVEEARHEAASGTPEKLREELVDLLFLVFDAMHRSGMAYGDIAKEAMAKLRKNMARKWPDWRTADPDKAVEHVRTEEWAGE